MSVQDVFRFEMIDAHEPDTVKMYTAIEYSSKLNVSSVKYTPGGSAANVAANLGNIGLQTAYIGKLGDDATGHMASDDLVKANVNLDACILTKEDTTALSVILITPLGKDRSILAYKGANNLIRPDEVDDEFLAGVKNLQWTSLTSQSAVDTITKCIDAVKIDGGIIFACPSISIIKNNHDAAVDLVKKSDLLVLNKEELFELTWTNNLTQALREALSFGPKIVACTDGGDGSVITDGITMITAGVYKIDVADTTGAGDAFASGLIYSQMNGSDLEQGIKLGSAMAAFECMVMGVREGIPHSIQEIEEFIANNELRIEKTTFPEA